MDVTVRMRSLVWFACGAVVALCATLVVTESWRADAAPGDEDATFVPLTPCRLADTRPGSERIGSIGTFDPDDTETFQAHGRNGQCVVPADATALSLNVTALGATAPTYLALWPEGPRPVASSLNPSPGQPPTPNAVVAPLSGSGAFQVYNLAGNVDVIIDVNGYYAGALLRGLHERVMALESSQPFVVSEYIGGYTTSNYIDISNYTALTGSTATVAKITVTAPAAGRFTVTTVGTLAVNGISARVTCELMDVDADPEGNFASFSKNDTEDWDEAVTLVRSFEVAAQTTTTFYANCRASGGGNVEFTGASITALFTPAA